LLDESFTTAFTDYINPLLSAGNRFKHSDMFEAFKLVGHRPEALRNIVGEIALSAGADQLGQQLRGGAEEIKQRIWFEMESEFSALPALQRVILETMIAQGGDYVPFSEYSMRAYSNLLEQKKIQVPAVQSALDALRGKGFVWKAAYGNYALEDESMVNWYNANRQQ
jgi:hypothetical protein